MADEEKVVKENLGNDYFKEWTECISTLVRVAKYRENWGALFVDSSIVTPQRHMIEFHEMRKKKSKRGPITFSCLSHCVIMCTYSESQIIIALNTTPELAKT